MYNHVPATQPAQKDSLPLQRKPTLKISEHDDAYEREADRVADTIVNGGLQRPGLSLSKFSVSPPLQREGGAKKKSEEDKYLEAAKKAGEAFLETAPGKEIKQKAEKLGDAFISTLAGKVIAGSAITGTVVALAATHSELPVGIPEIPLDKIKPGLKMKITWEGPVDKPTKVMATFSVPLGPKQKSRKPKMSKSQQFRAKTARMAMEQQQFRESIKTPQQRAEDQAMVNAWVLSQMTAPGSPLALGLSGPGLPPPLAPYAPEYKISGEQPKQEPPKKKKKEDRVQRKANRSTRSGGTPVIVNQVLECPGQPLEPTTRSFMESRFGYDFSQVRVHTNARAARSARAINATAYTVGHNLVFANGSYSPTSPQGIHLLAHELTHVIQQRAAAPVANDGPRLATRARSSLEQEADGAALSVLRGDAVSSGSFSPLGPVQRIQRAEHGTYVSTHGPKKYLDAGAKYYRSWRHPNVRRVSNMDDVLTDLGRARGTIDKFRIVSHGTSVGLWLGLLPQLSPDKFGSKATKFSTEARFRKHFADAVLINEKFFKSVYGALHKDNGTGPMLKLLGATSTAPAATSDLGIVLRAMVEQRFLSDVKLDTGGRAKIPHRTQLDAFISQRLNLYRKIVVKKGSNKKERKELAGAIAGLIKNLPAVMAKNSIPFASLTQQEAQDLANPFVEASGKNVRLSRELSKSVEEGAGGPYLRKLRRVKSKITPETHIEIRGCNVGDRQSLLDDYRRYFGQADKLPSISAPDLYQFYFKLGYGTYTTRAEDKKKLKAAFDDPSTGLAQGFEDLKRMKAGEMTRVVNETTLAQLAKKYGFNAAKVRKLNPEIKDPNKLKSNQVVWLVQRRRVPAGIYKSLNDFCRDYLGNQYAWPQVWAANRFIKNPSALKPTDQLQLPATVLTATIAASAPTRQELNAAVRSGQAVAGLKTITRLDAVTGLDTESIEPVVHMDNSKRAKALGEWLAAQKFDPRGRSAFALSRLYKRNFVGAAAKTYINVLSQKYPNIENPIFPEDPRYDKHIIRRP